MADLPHLAAAFLCESILEDKEGVLSAIRIVDIFRVTPFPEGALPAGARPVVNMYALVAFKKATPNDEIEEHELKLTLQTPTNAALEMLPATPLPLSSKFTLKEEGSGANIRIQIHLELKEFGLFWFNVFVDGQLISRIPFRILPQPKPE